MSGCPGGEGGARFLLTSTHAPHTCTHTHTLTHQVARPSYLKRNIVFSKFAVVGPLEHVLPGYTGLARAQYPKGTKGLAFRMVGRGRSGREYVGFVRDEPSFLSGFVDTFLDLRACMCCRGTRVWPGLSTQWGQRGWHSEW